MTGIAPNTHNAERIVSRALQQKPHAYLVGIAGIPGSGKTTLSQVLIAQCPGTAVVPMDGYHLPRSQLDAEGLRRRGAPHTFDTSAFRADIARLRQLRSGSFPRSIMRKKTRGPTRSASRRKPRW